MKVIEQEFVRSGFDHKIVVRDGMVALVERKHREAGVPHWEVIRIRVKPERSLHGRRVEEGEAYPSPEEWGTYAWTYNTLEEAQAKFAELTKLTL